MGVIENSRIEIALPNPGPTDGVATPADITQFIAEPAMPTPSSVRVITHP